MNCRPSIAAIAAALALCIGAADACAAERTITLPPDGVQLKANTLPGYDKARANCMTCHSAEYMLYQPPNAPRPYWEAMVKRMKQVFNGPINEEDMPLIVDYLVKTYGNEQAR